MTIIETPVTQARTGRSLIGPELFARLSARITTGHDIGAATADRIVDQALAFLGACAVATAPLSPSKQVDIGWHTFILYTRDYAEFCDRIAGRFIHHIPTDDSQEPAGPVGAWETTAAIVAAGYTVDAAIWEDAKGQCTGCHNGCHHDPAPNPDPEAA